jgi:hypothetical protein
MMVALAAAGGAVWLLGMAFARAAQRNRALLVKAAGPYNAVMRRIAGRTPHAPFAVLMHTGRRSGRTYETPLGAFPFGDGFVLALAYGREVDWCRNVLATGTCQLRWKGQEFALERPEIIPISACWDAFDLPSKFNCWAAGIKECLWIHRQSKALAPTPANGKAPVAAQ